MMLSSVVLTAPTPAESLLRIISKSLPKVSPIATRGESAGCSIMRSCKRSSGIRLVSPIPRGPKIRSDMAWPTDISVTRRTTSPSNS